MGQGIRTPGLEVLVVLLSLIPSDVRKDFFPIGQTGKDLELAVVLFTLLRGMACCCVFLMSTGFVPCSCK